MTHGSRGPSARQYGMWVLVCAGAELLGIGGAAGWWVLMDVLNAEPQMLSAKLVMLLAKALSGIVEGMILGSLQGLMLRRFYPALPLKTWIGWTAAVAVLGWAMGSAMPIFGGGPAEAGGAEPPFWLLVGFGVLFGAVVGALFGGAQVLALRKAVTGVGWWPAMNALGWAMALPIIYIAASLPEEGSGIGVIAASAFLSGALAGLTLGAVTGLAFWRMAPRVT